MFPGHGIFQGKIFSSGLVDSTLYPDQEREAYTINYPADDTNEDLEEEEVRCLIYTSDRDDRKQILQGLLPAFEYLESRIGGTCDEQYSCARMYDLCRFVRAFDPTYAAQYLTPDMVAELSKLNPIAHHVIISDFQCELPSYLSKAAEVAQHFNDDVDLCTKAVPAL
ncbi:MAG: hypothetical protein SGPRY_006299 [Prymnesium sp.]